MKQKIVSFILAITMIAILCFSITACSDSALTVDLNEYIRISTEGYDGSGSAYASFDYLNFSKDYGNDIKLTRKGEEEFYGVDYNTPAYALYGYVFDKGSLDKDDDLSNGDKITYSWNINSDTSDRIDTYFNVDLKYSDITVTVSELQEIETFDAFENVTVEVDGTEPYGVAHLYEDGILPTFDYMVEPSSGLSNGDIVTVTLREDADYYLDTYDVKPEEMSCEYTVEGLPYFVSELSQIPEDGYEEMQTCAEEAFYSVFNSVSVSDREEVNSLDCIGYYLLTPKDGVDANANIIYLIYQVDILQHGTNADGSANDTHFVYYTYYDFGESVISVDGEFSTDLENYDTCSNTITAPIYDYTLPNWIGHNITLYYYGYTDLYELIADTITPKTDTYNYETTLDAVGNSND